MIRRVGMAHGRVPDTHCNENPFPFTHPQPPQGPPGTILPIH